MQSFFLISVVIPQSSFVILQSSFVIPQQSGGVCFFH